jgi:cation diffusion facilitator family transporter
MIGIVVMAVSVVAKEGMAQYAIRAGKKTGARSLVADGWHHRSDAISSVIILTGILVSDYFWWIDGAMGILVALILFYVAVSIMKGSVSAMIGEKPDDDLIKDVIELSRTVYPEDIDLHHVHVHYYGKHAELTCHIYLPGEITLDEAHGVASHLERMIEEKYSLDVTVHMEPKEKNDSG